MSSQCSSTGYKVSEAARWRKVGPCSTSSIRLTRSRIAPGCPWTSREVSFDKVDEWRSTDPSNSRRQRSCGIQSREEHRECGAERGTHEVRTVE